MTEPVEIIGCRPGLIDQQDTPYSMLLAIFCLCPNIIRVTVEQNGSCLLTAWCRFSSTATTEEMGRWRGNVIKLMQLKYSLCGDAQYLTGIRSFPWPLSDIELLLDYCCLFVCLRIMYIKNGSTSVPRAGTVASKNMRIKKVQLLFNVGACCWRMLYLNCAETRY